MATNLPHADRFAARHIGPSKTDVRDMIEVLGLESLNDLIEKTIPESILYHQDLNVPAASPEHVVISDLRRIGRRNKIYRSYIGMGYHDTITPRAILRAILENPSWYTQYTPYQAEISQGRLEALLNFQTAVIDLTGMEIANASLLDEGTAAAEAMMLFFRLTKNRNKFLISQNCHPQTISIVEARSLPLGIEPVITEPASFEFTDDVFGALVQYPGSDGIIDDYASLCQQAHQRDAKVAVATDLLSLALIRPPGEFGADAVVGNSQRFGVPLGYGGPHAAFFATKNAFRRQVPGRMIGVTVDIEGKPALRMALQMREQHIKRARATSNICTAQALLAVMAGAYAVFHGPDGIKNIALCVHMWTRALANGLQKYGYDLRHQNFFDTLCIENPPIDVRHKAESKGINLRYLPDGAVSISLNETTTEFDVNQLLSLFIADHPSAQSLIQSIDASYEGILSRDSSYLTHPIFNRYHSETELMRYLHRLSSKDLSLTTSMIPLGSCTMKLNAAAQLSAVSWADYNGLHPFIPVDQTTGYQEIFKNLETWLAELTGFSAVSLQPNSGASGEYAGLLVIRAYLASKGESYRNICLVPDSAHGTNPASAVMAGMKVVVIKTLTNGDIDFDDLNKKLETHSDHLAALMITYPTTFGIFEEQIRELCAAIHTHGGQVYMDGANMNAQVGLCKPGDFGADVCHLNLHKTFAIPHGGGGPGVGPICVADHLAPFLPSHPVIPTGGDQGIGPVAAAPYGSASILLISWAYIALLGPNGLRRCSEVAILNANYLAQRLSKHYDILFQGSNGYVAHEFILDLRPLKKTADIDAVDIAKRLMDYGYHAPTMSWPVAGTMMLEPTESESKAELDRFCNAMISIRKEISEIESGNQDRKRNILKQAPHTVDMVCADNFDYPYSRSQAAFPVPWTREYKFWPPVRRIDEAYGDRHFVCSCPPIQEYQ